MKRIAVVLLAAIATQAQAQEQTVEGAQEFLRISSEQYAFGRWAYMYANVTNQISYGEMKFHPVSRCVTSVEGKVWFSWDGKHADNALSNEQNVAVLKRAFLTQVTGASNIEVLSTSFDRTMSTPIEVDWASVTSVSQPSTINGVGNPQKTLIQVNSSKLGQLTFTTTDTAIANRLAFAMEFLRVNCDAAASTGF